MYYVLAIRLAVCVRSKMNPGVFTMCTINPRNDFPLATVLAYSIAVFLIIVGVAPTTVAEERGTFASGRFDRSQAVIFEDPTPRIVNQAISTDGKLRAESEYKRIRVYNVEGGELLHEFPTLGSTTSPMFSGRWFDALCGGMSGEPCVRLHALFVGFEDRRADTLGRMWRRGVGHGHGRWRYAVGRDHSLRANCYGLAC